MAEIKMEKKSSVWPWVILIILIIAGLLYFFVFNDDDSRDNQDAKTEQNSERPSETLQHAPNNSTVVAYVNFVKEDTGRMGLDHEFTNEALLKLRSARQAMALEVNHDIQNDMDQVRNNAEKTTKEPLETTRANSIRQSADILASALQQIQQMAFPDLTSEADRVVNAARAIDPDVLTLDQKHEIKNSFSESADLLDNMSTNSPQTKNHVRKQ